MVPSSTEGRLLAALTSLCGILVLAIPITVISTNFNSEYELLMKERGLTKLRLQLLKDHVASGDRNGAAAMKREMTELLQV